MTRHEWFVAGLTALLVAMITLATAILPRAWAEEEQARVTIPSLPSTTLTITEINAKISASATPVVGQQVKVKLQATVPKDSLVSEIPVIITVFRTESSEMSRMAPIPQQIAQQTVTMKATKSSFAMDVDFPLYWADPKAIGPPSAVGINFKVTTTYSMKLSSPLGGDAAATPLRQLQEK